MSSPTVVERLSINRVSNAATFSCWIMAIVLSMCFSLEYSAQERRVEVYLNATKNEEALCRESVFVLELGGRGDMLDCINCTTGPE
jgi:hypothetical protein